MQRWEYRELIRVTTVLPTGEPKATYADSHGAKFDGDEPAMQVINQLGRDGWELIHVNEKHHVGEQSAAEMAMTTLWFKRTLGTL